MVLLIQYTLIFASVLAMVALGGCFSEHSGVINLGLEGVMVMGALGGALCMKALSASSLPRITFVTLIILAAGLVGVLYSALLGNIMAPAVATVIVKAINMSENPDNVSATVIYGPARKELVQRFYGFQFNWFMLLAVIAIILAWVILYRTKFGLRLMACGENPQAADSVGINVLKMRWAGVLISGLLGGIGGVVYITAGVAEWKFETGVAGFGFLALAVMIFGQWKPVNIGLAALLFGFFRALSNVYSGLPLLANLKIPGTVYNMMPYIISLIVLAFTSKNSRAPKAEGIPYDKGTR